MYKQAVSIKPNIYILFDSIQSNWRTRILNSFYANLPRINKKKNRNRNFNKHLILIVSSPIPLILYNIHSN